MVILLLFNLIFFWGIYTNLYQLATSELLSTFFTTWIWQGREWSKWRIPKYDPCYWLNAHAHPVLSTYYPVHILSSLLGNLFGLDTAFKVFVYSILGHYLFASVGWFLLLKSYFNTYVALFGAITFTYQAYHIKQQPCIVYTLAWFPWIAICPWLAVGMILSAGYYPLAIYLLPLGLFLNHDILQWAIGFLTGSIQVIPFLRYLPKTIRTKKVTQPKVGFWETNFYFGITPIIFLLMNLQWRYLWVGVPIVGSYLVKNQLPRVFQRCWIISAYMTILFSLMVLQYQPMVIPLFLIQCLDLWLHNRNLIPTRPFSELPKKPSLAFNNRLTRYLESNLGDARVSGFPFPLFTGHINRLYTLGYSGGMQLKLMAKWRNDTNSNGSGEHDYFRSNTDDERLSRARCKFAYSRKKLNWLSTPLRHLYQNPEYR